MARARRLIVVQQPTWQDDAHQAMERLAESGEFFTVDDLLALVGPPDTGHRANGTNNGIGSLFRAYARRGRIRAVGVERSKEPTRKGGMVRVWTGVPLDGVP